MDIYSLGEECVDVILSSWKGSYVYIDLSKKQPPPPRKKNSPPSKIFEQGENFHFIHNSAEEEKLFHRSQTTHISRETFSLSRLLAAWLETIIILLWKI